MITFQTLKFRNFLSTGNSFTEIDLRKNKTTLVVGQNGAGKSTMLDALSFALFGKPHRNITKSQIVNSINQKNCVVQVEFFIGKAKYRVLRGIKPNFGLPLFIFLFIKFIICLTLTGFPLHILKISPSIFFLIKDLKIKFIASSI